MSYSRFCSWPGLVQYAWVVGFSLAIMGLGWFIGSRRA